MEGNCRVGNRGDRVCRKGGRDRSKSEHPAGVKGGTDKAHHGQRRGAVGSEGSLEGSKLAGREGIDTQAWEWPSGAGWAGAEVGGERRAPQEGSRGINCVRWGLVRESVKGDGEVSAHRG